MACITGGDGQQYCDGEYSGLCSREKQKRNFYGTVSLTETGRILATGPCEMCSTPITRVLYTP